MRRRPWALAAAALTITAGMGDVAVADPRPRNWRAEATPGDRERLRHWRSAWLQGLAAARAGDGAQVIADEPLLFDPDRQLVGPMPPPGAYRCRGYKLGIAGMAAGVSVYPWGACRVAQDGGQLRLSRLDGPQRPSGAILADTDARAILLGTMRFSDEAGLLDYGRDPGRDLVGIVERIDQDRWRLVLPFPRFGSTIDVVDLRPVN